MKDFGLRSCETLKASMPENVAALLRDAKCSLRHDIDIGDVYNAHILSGMLPSTLRRR